jgi:DNA-binding Lrp family transcriptional regulator
MTVEAYVLIQTAVHAPNVADDIEKIDGVISADDVSGPYDVIVRVGAEDMDELGKLVVARIQGVEGITRTLTCPIVELG